MCQIFKRALSGIDTVSRWAIVTCMLIMISVVSTQVLLRYVFSYSLDWAEEISRLTFVWSVFMAIPHGVKLSAHVGIDVLSSRFPQWMQNSLYPVIGLVSGALMTMVAYQSSMEARNSWDQMMPTLDMSTGWFYLAVSVGCAHSALHLFNQVFHRTTPDTSVQENAA